MNRRLYVRDKSILLSLTGKIFYGQKVVMRGMKLPEHEKNPELYSVAMDFPVAIVERRRMHLIRNHQVIYV